MKDISLYTVMVSLKLKEKRELQNWAKKTLSQKYSDNAVKVFQKYLRGEAGAEEDLLRMSGIETVLRQIYKDEAGSVFKKYLQGGDEVVESLLQMADNGEVQITRELVDSLNKAMREEKVPMPAECMMELYHSEDEFLVKMSKEYAVINYGDYVYECIHKYYSTYATFLISGILAVYKFLKGEKFFMKKLSILICLAGTLALSGCTKIQSSSPEDGYNTEFAMSATEYSIFLSKQIVIAENVLMTRMSMADKLAEGNYDISSEIENTEQSISKIQDVKDEIFVTLPAENMSSDREAILSILEDSLSALEDYENKLVAGETASLKTSAAEIKNCYIALSGEANIYAK